jgi:hypothetical protein
VIGRGDYHWQHEPCWYAQEGRLVRRRQANDALEHPQHLSGHKVGPRYPKPVECMRRPIENNSSPGQAVCEPFSGSGTTIIAAQIAGRPCHAIELSPQYVDVAVERGRRLRAKPRGCQGRRRSGEARLSRPAHKPDPAQRRQVGRTKHWNGSSSARHQSCLD